MKIRLKIYSSFAAVAVATIMVASPALAYNNTKTTDKQLQVHSKMDNS